MVLAGVFNLLCELDDENRVLACESHEDDEADLRKDIIVHSPQQHSRERREDPHGNNKNDGKGKCPAFVLRGQGQEDEKDAKREDEERRYPPPKSADRSGRSIDWLTARLARPSGSVNVA